MAHSGAQFFADVSNFGYKGGKGSHDTEDLGPQTTEWEDQLRKHKIIGKVERLETVDEVNTEWREEQRILEDGALERKTLEELDEMEDDIEERALRDYRKARIQQLKEQQNKNRFGFIKQISEPEFVSEVSQASADGSYVLCCLYVDGEELSTYALKCLAQVASRHQDVKIVKIISRECIHNYPDEFCPTILIYHNAAAIGHIKRDELGGYGLTSDTLEFDLAMVGCWVTDQDEDPMKKFARLKGRKKGEAVRRAAFRKDAGLEGDEDSDDLLDL